MNYPQAVATAKSLLARIDADHWELARITYEVLTGGGGTIRGWAADLGISKPHAETLRNVWARYGRAPGQRTNRSFADCYELAKGSEERAERIRDRAEREGKTIREVAKEDARERRDRVGEARDLLRDRRRIKEVLDDPEIERAVEQELRARRRQRPVSPKGQGEQLQFDFKEDLASVEDQVYALLRQMVDREIEKSDRRDVVQTATRIRNEAQWIIACVTSGDPALIAALRRALAKNAPLGAPPKRTPTENRELPVRRTPPPPPGDAKPPPEPFPPADTEPAATPPKRRPTNRDPIDRRGPSRRLEPVGSG